MQKEAQETYQKSGMWLSLGSREEVFIKRGQGGGFGIGGNVLFLGLVGGYMETVCCVTRGSL